MSGAVSRLGGNVYMWFSQSTRGVNALSTTVVALFINVVGGRPEEEQDLVIGWDGMAVMQDMGALRGQVTDLSRQVTGLELELVQLKAYVRKVIANQTGPISLSALTQNVKLGFEALNLQQEGVLTRVMLLEHKVGQQEGQINNVYNLLILLMMAVIAIHFFSIRCIKRICRAR